MTPADPETLSPQDLAARAVRGPVVLCILDGWGHSRVQEGNAPMLAPTPVFDGIMSTCPHATLITHGPDVGLPEGQMGNSEVGHTNIGAGRVVTMDLGQIDAAVAAGRFGVNPALGRFIAALQASGGVAHLVGLVSDGGVHGQLAHMLAAARLIAAAGVPVAIHAITDGRDVAPRSAPFYLEALEAGLPGGAFVATVSGRYFAMDRDNRWERVQAAFDAMVHGRGVAAATPAEAVRAAHAAGQTDEFVPPAVIGGYAGAQDGDGVFCLNFRADRAREILLAIGQPGFAAFDTGRRPDWAALLGMVDYSTDHDRFMATVYPKQDIVNTLGAWVAQHGLRQYRLAETEKYPHVTFFLNGGREVPEAGEDRFMPASPKVATYDLQPEMSSQEVTACFVEAIEAGYDLIVVNYANPDMVGHTGDLVAAMAACAAVDRGLAQVLPALKSAGGVMLLTADHGNCEMMIDPRTGGPHTAHTLNLVPVALIGGPPGARLRPGRLADVAPTLLALLGLPRPPEMTGESLIVP